MGRQWDTNVKKDNHFTKVNGACEIIKQIFGIYYCYKQKVDNIYGWLLLGEDWICQTTEIEK